MVRIMVLLSLSDTINSSRLGIFDNVKTVGFSRLKKHNFVNYVNIKTKLSTAA